MTMRGVMRVCGRPIVGSAAAASRRAVNWLFHHVQAISILSMHQFVRLLQQNRDMAKFNLSFLAAKTRYPYGCERLARIREAARVIN